MLTRTNPIALYLVCLGLSVCAYGAYAKFAVPLIEGHVAIDEPDPPPDVPIPQPAYLPVVERLFPPDAWQRNKPIALQNSEGIYLFQDYQELPDGYVDVFPFTMIALDKNAPPNAEPIVLQCAQGARLKLEQSFESGINQQQKRDVQRAQLQGVVLITRNSKLSDKKLKIVTKNIQIEKQRVFTLEAVEMQLGPNQITGRHLSVELAHKLNDLQTPGFSDINGIKIIELAFLERMYLRPAQTVQTPDNNESVFNNKSPIEITCDGPFRFNYDNSSASFSQNVIVKQLDGSGDNLRSDRLDLLFAKDAAGSADTLAAGFKLRRLIATGQPFVLDAQSRKSTIRGQTLNYDLEKNSLKAISQQQISIVTPDINLRAKQLQYTVPKHDGLGPLNAFGPGQLTRTDSNGKQQFQAEWQSLLTVRDVDDLKLVSMDGNVSVVLDPKTDIRSQKLKLWLAKKELLDHDPTPEAEPTALEFEPKRILATVDVEIRSPQLQGKTNHLTVKWPEQTAQNAYLPGDNQQPAQSPHRQINHWEQNSTNDRATTRLVSPAGDSTVQLSGFEQDIPADSNLRPKQPKHRFDFVADRVLTHLVSTKDNNQAVESLSLTGSVIVDQMQLIDGNAVKKLLHATGELFKFEPQTDPHSANPLYKLLVGGTNEKMATVRSDQLNLTGGNIHVDQMNNKMWIVGPGRIRLTQARGSLQNVQQSPPQNVDVSWQAGMVFDGDQVYFERDIVMTSEQQADDKAQRSEIKTLSQALNVQLKQPFDFKNLSSDESSKPEIRQITWVNSINPQKRAFQFAGHQKQTATQSLVVENSTYDASGRLTEKLRVIAPHATMNSETGQITATGPGAVQVHRLGNSTFGSTPESRARQRAAGNVGLTFIQVNFDKSLTANSNDRDMLITGNIRAIFTPVKNWQQQINPDEVKQVPDGATKITCSQIEVAQWQQRNQSKPQNEVIATGNAHIQGDLFDATAQRVSYDQGKDLLTMVGSSRSKAVLSYRTSAGGDPSRVVAAKVLYRISDQTTKFEKVDNIIIDSSRKLSPRRK